MRCTEAIVFALGALGEAGQAAALTQSRSGHGAQSDLVRIRLMADVPNDAVSGRIKNMMYCDGQFHDTKTGAKMTTRNRNCVDRFRANFRCNLRQIALFELAKIGGRLDCVEQWGR
jgi:hypothetical protein